MIPSCIEREMPAEAVSMFEGAPHKLDEYGAARYEWRIAYVYNPIDARGRRVWKTCGAVAYVRAHTLETALREWGLLRPCNSRLVMVELVCGREAV